MIDNFKNISNPSVFWKTFSFFKPKKFSIPSIDVAQWESFYDDIFQPRLLNDITFLGCRHPVLDREISLEELHSAIRSTKNNKAPGKDKFTNEFFKALPANGIDYILNLFNKIFETEDFPED